MPAIGVSSSESNRRRHTSRSPAAFKATKASSLPSGDTANVTVSAEEVYVPPEGGTSSSAIWPGETDDSRPGHNTMASVIAIASPTSAAPLTAARVLNVDVRAGGPGSSAIVASSQHEVVRILPPLVRLLGQTFGDEAAERDRHAGPER